MDNFLLLVALAVGITVGLGGRWALIVVLGGRGGAVVEVAELEVRSATVFGVKVGWCADLLLDGGREDEGAVWLDSCCLGFGVGCWVACGVACGLDDLTDGLEAVPVGIG